MATTNRYHSTRSNSPENRSEEYEESYQEVPIVDRESRIAYCIALSLVVFEVKRLLLLVVEMLLDLQSIRFAGALLPFIFSFLDSGFGFPLGLGAFYTIRKHKMKPYYPKIKRIMCQIVSLLLICTIMNLVTIILILNGVDANKDSIRDAFKNAMKFYARNANNKFIIDELQFNLQCCGHSSYMDWFAINWQGIDYVDVEGREEFGVRSIPFSCCNMRTIFPCFHAKMREVDVKTINSLGCVDIISGILFKIITFGCAVTTLIIFTQICLVVFLIKIIKSVMCEMCVSHHFCLGPSSQFHETTSFFSSDEDEHYRVKDNRREHKRKKAMQIKPRRFCQHQICESSSSLSSSTSSSGNLAILTSSPSTTTKSSQPEHKVCRKGRK